jgi:hypothetical protein
VVELLRARIEDEVGHHPAQHPPGDRHDRPRDQRSETATELDRDPHVPGQEGRDRAGEPLQVAAGDAEIFRAHHAVDETDGEIEPARVLEHPGEPLRSAVGHDVGALAEPATHGGDRLGGERIATRGRIGSGRGHASRLLARGIRVFSGGCRMRG